MFDFKNMNFVKTDQQHGLRHYSFVGIRRKPNSEIIEFWLPLGFDNFNHENYDLVKSFFFKMYKTFKMYFSRKNGNIISNSLTNDRDGVYEKTDGFDFRNKEDTQPVFYGKLNALDKIIEGYDELKILSSVEKNISDNKIDYSKIHIYMHQAVYLDNDVIYLDEMTIPKKFVLPESSLIIKLFCFIYYEVKKELGEIESISYIVNDLAYSFKEEYLQSGSSLFDEYSFNDTLTLLKDLLYVSEQNTVYKDEDFWHFFDAVEAFLYGEKDENDNGILWGVNNFYDLWEDMCHTYMISSEYYKDKILFADVKGKLKNFKNIKPNPFSLNLNKYSGRKLRPDLVLEATPNINDIFKITTNKKRKQTFYFLQLIDEKDIKLNHPEIIKKYNSYRAIEKHLKYGTFTYFTKVNLNLFEKYINKYIEGNDKFKSRQLKIIDFKYMKELDFNLYDSAYVDENGKNKIKLDIMKQLVYEWTLNCNLTYQIIDSEFWISYYDDNNNLQLLSNINNEEFNKSKIKVYKINFRILQDYYNQIANL